MIRNLEGHVAAEGSDVRSGAQKVNTLLSDVTGTHGYPQLCIHDTALETYGNPDAINIHQSD